MSTTTNSRLKSKVISSLFWKLFERGGRAAIELVVQIVMARLLAPDDFGALAIMLVFVNIGNVLVQSGLNTALVQALDVDYDDFSTVFWMTFSIALILFLAVFFAAPYISSYYEMDYLTWPLRFLMLILLINAFNSVQIAFIQRSLEFKKIFVATLVSITISGIVGVGTAILGFGLWALVVQQITYQVCNCVVLAFQVPWKPRLVFKADRAKTLFGFGWKLLVSGILEQCYQSFSDLIIGKFFSSAQLGYVSQGKKYPQALGKLLDGAIQPVMLSAVSRVQDDVSQVKRLVRRALRTSTFLIFPCMAYFALAAEPIVRIVLGEKWLISVPFLQMYCFVYALLPIHSSNLQALNGMGRSDFFLKLELIKKAYGICFILIGAFVFQDVYAMVALYMLSSLISTFVNAWPNRKVIGYSYGEQIRDICPSFVISLVSALVAYPLRALMLPDLALICLQACVFFVAYIALSKLFRIEMLDYLCSLLKEMLGKRAVSSKDKGGI